MLISKTILQRRYKVWEPLYLIVVSPLKHWCAMGELPGQNWNLPSRSVSIEYQCVWCKSSAILQAWNVRGFLRRETCMLGMWLHKFMATINQSERIQCVETRNIYTEYVTTHTGMIFHCTIQTNRWFSITKTHKTALQTHLTVHRLDLLQRRQYKHSRLSHARLGLAQDVHAQDGLRNALVLHWKHQHIPVLPIRPVNNAVYSTRLHRDW